MKLHQIIKTLSFFDPFSNEDLIDIFKFMEIRRYKSKDLIIDQSSLNTSLYFLLEGSLDVFVNNRLVSNEGRYGDVFGEMSISGKKSSYARVKSHEDSTLLVFNFLAVHEIPNHRKDYLEKLIYKSFSEVLACRLDRANQLIENIKKSA